MDGGFQCGRRRFPHSVHRYRVTDDEAECGRREATMQFITRVLAAAERNDHDDLKEILVKSLIGSMRRRKAFSRKHRRRMEVPRVRLPLISAVEKADLESVRRLLSEGVDCNGIQQNRYRVWHREGLSAIHRAAALGLTDIAEMLLKAGANPNAFDQNGDTALHIAVGQRNAEMVRLLLSYGANATLNDRHGNAAIHTATSFGHLNLVRTLIEFNADIHQTNSAGSQPVHIAATAGHFHITHLLCSADATNVMARDRNGQSPIHLAVENGHVETTTALLDLFGANPNEKNSLGEVPLHRLLIKPYRKYVMRDLIYYYATFMALVQYGASLDIIDSRGQTILEIALANHYTNIVEALSSLRGVSFVKCTEDVNVCNADRQLNVTAGPVERSKLPCHRFNNIAAEADGSDEVTSDVHSGTQTSVPCTNSDLAAVNEVSKQPHDMLDLQKSEGPSRKDFNQEFLLRQNPCSLPANKPNSFQNKEISESSGPSASGEKRPSFFRETASFQKNLPSTKLLQTSSVQPSSNGNISLLPKPTSSSSVATQQISADHYLAKDDKAFNDLPNKSSFVAEECNEARFRYEGKVDASKISTLAKDTDGTSDFKTGTVDVVRLETLKPSRCVIQKLSHPNGHLKAAHDQKLDAELGAFDRSIGFSDEDFSEDFLSDSNSSENSKYRSGNYAAWADENPPTLLFSNEEKHSAAENSSLQRNPEDVHQHHFSVKELIKYFEEDDANSCHLNYEKRQQTGNPLPKDINQNIETPEKLELRSAWLVDDRFVDGTDKKQMVDVTKFKLQTGSVVPVNSKEANSTSSQQQHIITNATSAREDLHAVKGEDILCLTKGDIFENNSNPASIPFITLLDMESETTAESVGSEEKKIIPDLLPKTFSSAGGCDEANEGSSKSQLLKRVINSIPKIQESTWIKNFPENEVRSQTLVNTSDLKKPVVKSLQGSCRDGTEAGHSIEVASDTRTKKLAEMSLQNTDEAELEDAVLHKGKMKKKTKKKEKLRKETDIDEPLQSMIYVSTEPLVFAKNGKQLNVVEPKSIERTEDSLSEASNELKCSLESTSVKHGTGRTEVAELSISQPSTLSGSEKHDKVAKKKKKRKPGNESVETTFVESTFDDDATFEFAEHHKQAAALEGLCLPSQQKCDGEVEGLAMTTTSKDMPEKKTKKKAVKTGKNRFTNLSFDERIINKNSKFEAFSSAEEYRMANTDNIPIQKHLNDPAERDAEPLLTSEFGSDIVNRRTKRSDGKSRKGSMSRKVRSELCSAFGISQETNIDDSLTDDGVKLGNSKREDRELVSDGFRWDNGLDEEKDELWSRVSEHTGKRDNLQRSFEIISSISENVAGNEESSAIEVFKKKSRRQRIAPSQLSVSCGSGFFALHGHSEPLVSSASSDFNSHEQSTISNSRETCIDDDDDFSNLEEQKKSGQGRKVISESSLSNISNHENKETDIDEVYYADETELPAGLRPKGKHVVAHSGTSVSSEDYIGASTAYHSRNFESPCSDSSSVEMKSSHKKTPKKSKSQKKLVSKSNSDIPETGFVPPYPGSPELVLNKSSKQNLERPDAFTRYSEESPDGREMQEDDLTVGQFVIDVEAVKVLESENCIETEESIKKFILPEDGYFETASVDGNKELCGQHEEHSASDLSQTESDESSESDDVSEKLVYGQPRTLFTIKEQNTEELEVEENQLENVVDNRATCKEIQPQDDWDDFDLSALCVRPLEKIKLTAQTVEVQRHMYEESDEDEEIPATDQLNNSISALKPLMVSSVTPDRILDIPSQNTEDGKKCLMEPTGIGNVSNIPPDHNSVDITMPLESEGDLEKKEEPWLNEVPEVVKVHPTKKKKKPVRSFVETSFDDMEPVSMSLSDCAPTTDKMRVASSIAVKELEAENISDTFKLCDSVIIPGEHLDMKKKPKIGKYAKKGLENRCQIPVAADSVYEDVSLVTAEETPSEKEEDPFEYQKNEGTRSRIPWKSMLKNNWGDKDVISDEEEMEHQPLKKEQEDKQKRQESENRCSEKEGLTAACIEEAEDVPDNFRRDQVSRVSRGRQKRGVRVSATADSGIKSPLTFESPPACDSATNVCSNKDGYKSKTVKFSEKGFSKDESVSLSPSFKKVSDISQELTTKEHAEKSLRVTTSKFTSKAETYRNLEAGGKPPLPRNAEKQGFLDAEGKQAAQFYNTPKNQAREVKGNTLATAPLFFSKNSGNRPQTDGMHRKPMVALNVRNPKIESNVVQQRGRNPLRSAHARSFEEEPSLLSRPPGRVDHRNSSFERPRSAEGILGDGPPHRSALHHGVHLAHQGPASHHRVSSSEDIRRKQLREREAEPQLKPLTVKEPQKTLQEAAFESITAGMLNQSRLQPKRSVKPADYPVSYGQGVYRPQPVVFRGSLSATSSYDESRTSAEMGYHPSSGSGNDSWHGTD